MAPALPTSRAAGASHMRRRRRGIAFALCLLAPACATYSAPAPMAEPSTFYVDVARRQGAGEPARADIDLQRDLARCRMHIAPSFIAAAPRAGVSSAVSRAQMSAVAGSMDDCMLAAGWARFSERREAEAMAATYRAGAASRR